MRNVLLLLVSWLLTGLGAAVGSILGHAAGPTGLRVGAILGGVLGLAAAVLAARRFGWLPSRATRAGFFGGLLGFALAVPLTLTHLQSPVVPVLSCSLVGLGVLAGARLAGSIRQQGSARP